MTDLKLIPLLTAVESDEVKQAVCLLFRGEATDPVLAFSRLEPPDCFWGVFRHGRERVTIKSFFSEAAYAAYTRQLAEVYPDYEDRGVALLEDVNAVLWRFPFDPTMPFLARCLDDAWI